MKTTVQFDIP